MFQFKTLFEKMSKNPSKRYESQKLLWFVYGIEQTQSQAEVVKLHI